MLPFPASALSDLNNESETRLGSNDDFPYKPDKVLEKSATEEKQFLPFMSPPAATAAAKESGPPPPGTKTVVEYEAKESSPLPLPRTRTGITDDLQDVLAAAQAAAESAERAAAVARTAASLAQLRISELIRKQNEDESTDNPFSGDNHQSNTPEIPNLDRQSSTQDHDGGFSSLSPSPQPFSPHQLQRLPSMDEDDGFMSYPNLFT
ncbi:hypothetical protein L6452_34676 [Arctium lappa]|uniref:Uncharacterized protein n=1 Tax=Arctium lappa TaxID=4217 RepID=A0ACB8YKF0_ARCLA|nr:hypothetical protein L6452_34676 [Arctium lappa]